MVDSNRYPNLMDINHEHYDINVREYLKRMQYVSENGCHTAILTGTSEPQQNKQFLATFALLHNQIENPFKNIEMQTTGMLLNDNRNYVRFLRNFVGVNTVALSVNSLFDEMNNYILGHKLKDRFVNLESLCNLLKEYDFNIRICCNLTRFFDMDKNPIANIFGFIRTKLHADQVTLREMYSSDEETEQGKWLKENQYPEDSRNSLVEFLDGFPMVRKTEYGTNIRDIYGMSVVYDGDCMGKNPPEDALKFLILRPNCKLYCSWDNESSLVF